MKKKRANMNIGAAILFVLFCLLFFILTYRFFMIQITGQVEGTQLVEKAEQKHVKSRILDASRGSILDRNGEPLAIDTTAYKLIAILNPKMSVNSKKPLHVVDPEKTAAELAKYIPMSEEEIYRQLTKKLDQVEFGTAGKNLSHEVKEKIEKLQLPGIAFVRQTKRSYPNGVFASHLLGFANFVKTKDNKEELVGQLGLEKSLNSYLTGIQGKIQYKSDIWGFILPNSEEHVIPPKDGANVYLTLDKKIQTFLEDAMSQVDQEYHPKKMMGIVADAKTGAILAMAQRPTFDPNTREGINENWHNIVVENAFEPGSTMKVFTLAASIEEGVFKANQTYQSGQFKVDGGTVRDHNYVGWGRISFLEGVQRSSNVAFAHLLKAMGTETFREYLDKFRFGQPTNIGLPSEASGKIQYKWPIDKFSTAYGQATSVTALQLVQAMTAITNDGKMMKPYIIQKIEDPSGKLIKRVNPEQIGQPISEKTAKEVRNILETVVTSEVGTGRRFQIEGYDVLGKTGTAQIYENGVGYLSGWDNYIFSFIGAAPKDDPRLIVYVMVQQPDLNEETFEQGSVPVSKIFNPVMRNSLQYLNIKPDKKIEKAKVNEIPNLQGKSVEEAKVILEQKHFKPVVIGNGEIVNKTIPNNSDRLLEDEIVIIVTDGEPTLPNMMHWSLRDVVKVMQATGLTFEIDGKGFVVKQNVKAGEKLNENSKVKITLEEPENIFRKEDEKQEETSESETPDE